MRIMHLDSQAAPVAEPSLYLQDGRGINAFSSADW